MRVLVFSTDDHLYPAGGAEQAFGNITERLPDIQFDLVCARLRRNSKKYEEIKNVNIYRIGFGIPKLDGILLALFGSSKARKLIKIHKYDLIWSVMASYGAFSAVRLKLKTGIPFLLTLQEGDSFEYIYEQVKHVRKQFNSIFENADAIQAISNYLLNWGKEMGYKGELGRVIPNGVAIQAYTQVFDIEQTKETRNTFGFPEDATILFSTSRLEKKNGHADIIKSLVNLPENICFINWHVGSLRDELNALAEKLEVSHRVNLAAAVEPEKIPLLAHSCDIFIRPSLSEGLGNSFLEAMAAQKIVIGTNAGGIPDFLTDGETGFVVEIENPQSIADTVQKVISLDDEEKEQILHKAKDMVISKYNWDVISKDMENMFNEITKCKQ